MKILLVEDDPLLAQILTKHLKEQHYIVDVAIDGVTGFDYAQATSYDLAVLDINLPRLNGIELCGLLRRSRQTLPILLLTAEADSAAKVIGLDAGADDYVVKPCPVEEISARIRALLRRPSLDETPILSWGNLQLNPTTLEVSCSGGAIALSPKEYSLLELLLRHPQRIFSSSSLLEQLWSFAAAPSEETVRSHIKRLRRKLKTAGSDDPIETVHGIGYRLRPAAVSPATTAADQARAAAFALWEQFKQPILERVACLDRTVAALETDRLSDDLRQTAAQAAHKLTGSLALFGFPDATQIGRDLEQLLRSNPPLSVSAIRSLVEQLHGVLESMRTIKPAAVPVRWQCPVTAQPDLLIVDSDIALAEQLQRLAEQSGMRVSIAATPDAARSMLAVQSPDVMLLDWGFSDADETGPEFLATVRRLFPGLPILLFSRQDSFMARLAGVRGGCDRFLPKTMPLDQVCRAVREVLQPIAPLKVLAVDDDVLVLHQLQRCLSTRDIQLTLLSTPEPFWQTLEAVQPDLVLLDLKLPSISGIELCQVIRSDRTWQHLPILFLTAQQAPEALLAIHQAGADGCLSKPLREAELVAQIWNRSGRALRLSQSALQCFS